MIKRPILQSTLAVAAAAFASAGVSTAQTVSYTTPHTTTASGAETITLGDTTFINQGLQGVGRISASTLDAFGETMGAASGLQITNWTGTGGTYTGTLNILPDRGYNLGNFFSAYAARIEQVNFSFTPYTGTANIGGTDIASKVAAQNQISFTAPITGVKFTYDDPITGTTQFTTGLDPGTSTATIFGKSVPYVVNYTGLQSPSATSNTTYTNINQLTLDSEALVLKSDGSGYIGDEYGANIYHFDANKKIDGVITPPAAIQPHTPAGTLNFNSVAAPIDGRRNNQGMEGVALSPDGTRLYALLQSAAVQDASNSANQTRLNTRLLVYDVSGSTTPGAPIQEYALQLPTYTGNGGGGAVNNTAAQSEIVVVDKDHILVLPRDANGLGSIATNQSVTKSVILVDLRGGTNIAGTSRDNEGGLITTAPGVLDPAITPLTWAEAINLLNTTQLGKFNLQLDAGGTSQVSKLTLGEKWEGMTFVSANDTAHPNDYFLFVANDNDFLTSQGKMIGPDGTLVDYNGFNGYPAQRIPGAVDPSTANENDIMFLAYRVTIEPVPEPSTYALMLAGLVGVGLIAGRRRK
jgi:hypothetical protein